jgi:hypothetical protein
MIALVAYLLSLDPLGVAVVGAAYAYGGHARTLADVMPYVEAARIAEARTGVSARLLMAIAVVESGAGASLTGDDGDACGAWQYHARWSPACATMSVEAVCAMLRTEPLEAAMHAAEYIAAHGPVCHYQQGHTCRDGETYTDRVEAVRRML